MKAFVVRVNGKRLCTAGLGPRGVLTAMVSWVGLRPGHDPEGAFTFHVGGLDSRTDEHLEYATPLLRVGDKVSVEIVETEVFDREDKRYVPDFSRRPGESPAKATVRRQRKGGKRGKDRRSTR